MSRKSPTRRALDGARMSFVCACGQHRCSFSVAALYPPESSSDSGARGLDLKHMSWRGEF